ncbi:MAG: conserved exported protein of unknown function [Candidatus Thorarchaeota archaeon]|nr:MAG: conserved exported protein of unknown function [Candidatus Thorarchaeota archaeon]
MILVSTIMVLSLSVLMAAHTEYSFYVSNEPQPTLFQPSYEEHIPVTIVDENGFIAHGFSGSGTIDDPYLIENLFISDGTCIKIRNIDSYHEIRNCYFEGVQGFPAIILQNTSNGVIRDCIIEGDPNYGVHLSSVNNTILVDSGFYGGNHGVVIENSYDCDIVRCITSNNEYGVSTLQSHNITVTDCKIYGNLRNGINLDEGTSGTLIFNNSIGWNGGIITIYPLSNAHDDGIWNRWDNGSMGNRWSNLATPSEYEIEGNAGSEDHFPSALIDLEAPILSGSEDLRIDSGSDSIAMWNASDAFPYTYEVSVDGTNAEKFLWIENNITVNLDFLSAGQHNLTLEVRDARGNVNQDTINIIVYPRLVGGLGTEIVVLASLFSILSLIVIILLMKRI